MDFVTRVLRIFADDNIRSDLEWTVDDCGKINFTATCPDDLFGDWIMNDAEAITEENLPILEQCMVDCKLLDPEFGKYWATDLFVCKIRKMRPHGLRYPDYESILWPLFDACGPEQKSSGTPYEKSQY